MNAGIRIRKARRDKSLTQDALAEAINVTKSTISQWESGKTKPDYKNLAKICEITGKSADYIVRGKEVAFESKIDKRVNGLPDAFREYVLISIDRAEKALKHIDPRFLNPPTNETYPEFEAMLSRLIGETR